MERTRSLRRRRRPEKPLSTKIKDCIRSFVAFMFSNVGIIGLVVGYAIAGSFIFMNIEAGVQNEHTEIMSAYRNKTAEKLWNLTYITNILDRKTWRDNVTTILWLYQNDTVDAIKNGFDGSESDDYSKQWSFSGAFLYSLTVITTIGYGNLVPRTFKGKITTIIYAIIGMPLFLLYLSNIGDIMARSFKWLYATCYLCKGCPGVSKRRAERRQSQRYQEEYEMDKYAGYTYDDERSFQANQQEFERVRRENFRYPEKLSLTNSDESDESFDTQTVTVPITLCLTMMVGYIFGGALLFSKYESWNWLDGSYFCFISLSTIGFGDLVPGDKITNSSQGFLDIELSFIFCSMYLMLGMALIAMCFNLMQEEVIHKFRTTVSTLKYICRCKKKRRVDYAIEM